MNGISAWRRLRSGRAGNRQNEARLTRACAALSVSLLAHAVFIHLALLGRLHTEQARLSMAQGQDAGVDSRSRRDSHVFTVIGRLVSETPRAEPAAAASGQSVPTAEQASPAQTPAPSLGTDWLAIDGTRFIPASQLTRSPQIYEAPSFDLPELKTAGGGKIRMALWVDREGRVVAVEIQQAPLGASLAANALAKMLRKSEFIPGLLNGERVGSIVNVEIELEAMPGLPIDSIPPLPAIAPPAK